MSRDVGTVIAAAAGCETEGGHKDDAAEVRGCELVKTFELRGFLQRLPRLG